MSKDSEQNKLALALTVGTLISSNIVGGLLAGYFLDRWLGTGPWLLIIGLLLGTFGAFFSLYRIMSRLD
ncbi:MAG TPA: AtpZ/AtpI family protein [Blastocatellia bacterium]|nr:AtpZ/AtpI family protein [Blastocatellia bacterium]